jgi:hypothetical protein
MEEQFQPGLSSGYAVMTRIWVVDHWTWATWMCFDTCAQAVAHARKGDKVVRFASAAWATLKHQESAAQPEQSYTASPVHPTERPTLPSKLGDTINPKNRGRVAGVYNNSCLA